MAKRKILPPHTRYSAVAVDAFRAALLEWFRENRRDFPWRTRGASLYMLTISEIMLQRTTAAAVAGVLPGFLERFPHWESIDQATREELEVYLRPLGLWQRRVDSLQRLARELVLRGGVLPLDREELERLPGVGQYISNAVRLFGKGEPEPLLDVNMSRVLERYFGPRDLADIRYDPYLQALSRSVVDSGSPVDVNWAILDLGAMVCRSRAPRCDSCPLAAQCAFARNPDQQRS